MASISNSKGTPVSLLPFLVILTITILKDYYEE